MNNSKIDQAKREQKDIETQINIIRSMIDKYSKLLECDYPEEVLIGFKTSLQREEQNLQKMKDKYPEHII